MQASQQQLKQFRPLNQLTEQQLVLLVSKSTLSRYESNTTVLELNSHDNLDYFLTQGEIELESFDGRFKTVNAQSDTAKAAIASLQPRKYRVKTKTACEFLIIEKHVIKLLLEETPLERPLEYSTKDTHTGQESAHVINSFKADLKSNNLVLPSFPGVALNIHKLLAQDDVDSQAVSDLLNTDPAMVVKLIRTCNSPLYRTVNEITSSKDAVVRLGFETTRKLINIFVLKELFRSKNKVLNDKIKLLWEHAREVASIAYILADITPGLDKEQALLAGLVHEVGAIPILSYIESFPEFMKVEAKLEGIMCDHYKEVGVTLLETWGFQEEMINVVRHSEEWEYESGQSQATYTDVVIAAQVHSAIMNKAQKQLPSFNKISALRKLGKDGLTPETSMNVLADAQKQLCEVSALLA